MSVSNKSQIVADIISKFADSPTGNITAADLREVTIDITQTFPTGAGDNRQIQIRGTGVDFVASPNLSFSTGNVLTIPTGSIVLGASNPVGLDFTIGTGGLPAAVSWTSLRGSTTTGLYFLTDSDNPLVLDGGSLRGRLRIQVASMNTFYESAQQHHFYSAADGHLATITSSAFEPALNFPMNIGLRTRPWNTGFVRKLNVGTGGQNSLGLDMHVGTGGVAAAVNIVSYRGATTTGVYILSDSTNPLVVDGGTLNGRLRIQLGNSVVFYESATEHHFYSAANGHLITLAADTIEPSLNLPYNIGLASRRFGTGFIKKLSLGTGGGGNSILVVPPTNLEGSYTLTLPPNDGASGQILSTNGVGVTTWVNQSGGGGGSTSPGGSNREIQFNDNGAFAGVPGFTLTTNTGLVVQGSGYFAGKVDISGLLTVNSAIFVLRASAVDLWDLTNSKAIVFKAPNALDETYNFILPTTGGLNGQVLGNDGAGNLRWVNQSGGGGSATPGGSNRQIQFNNSSTFGGVAGFELTTSTGLIVSNSGSFGGNVTLYNAKGIILSELTSNGTDAITLKAPDSLGGSYTFTLPPNDGSAGQVLQTDGNGITSWVNQTGSGGGGGGSTSPGGSDRYIQFNDNGSFGGNAGFILTNNIGIVVSDSGSFGNNVTLHNNGGLILKENSSNGQQSVTLSAPSSISSSYTFTFPTDAGGANQVLRTDGNGNTSWVNQTGAGGGGSTSPGGSNRQVQFNDNGAFGGSVGLIYTSDQGLAVGGSGTFNGNLTLYNNAALILTETTSNGTSSVTLIAPTSLSSSYTLTLPGDDGSAGQVLRTDGNGNLTWVNQTGGGGATSPGGSNRQIQFNDNGAFGGNSNLIFTSNGGIEVGGSGTFGDNVYLYNGKSLVLRELTANGSSDITLKAPDSLSSSYTFTLPPNDGSNGQVLQTDGNGTTSWVNQSGGGGSTSPGGTDRSVQFNNSSSFGGVNGFLFTSTQGLVVPGSGSYAGYLTLQGNYGLVLKDNSTNSITIIAPTSVSSYTLTLPADDGAAGQVLRTDGNGTLSWVNQTGAGGGGTSPGGSNRQVQFNDNGAFGGSSNFVFTSNGGIEVGSSGNFGGAITIQSNNTLNLKDQDGSIVAVKAHPTSTAYTFRLPSDGGSNGQVLATDGFGSTSWVNQTGGGGGGSTSPGGSTTHVQYNNGGSFAGSSAFRFVNNGIIVGGSGSFDDDLHCRGFAGIRLYDNGSDYVGLYAPTLSASYTLQFPTTNGNAGEVLVTDGNGVLSWAPSGAGGGGSTSPAGSTRQIQFNNAGSFGASANLVFDGSNILTVTGGITCKGDISVEGGNVGNGLNLYYSNNAVQIIAPSSVSNWTLTLPTDGGSNGQVLTTNGAGTTSWVTNSTTLTQAPFTNLTLNTKAVTIAGASNEVSLMEADVPSGTFDIDGDYVEFEAFGNYGEGKALRNINFWYGNSKIVIGPLQQNGGAWRLNGIIMRESDDSQVIQCTYTPGVGSSISTISHVVNANQPYGSGLVKITYSGIPSVTQRFMSVKWIPKL